MEKLVYAMSLCHLVLPLMDTDYGIALPFMLAADAYLVKLIRELNLADRG